MTRAAALAFLLCACGDMASAQQPAANMKDLSALIRMCLDRAPPVTPPTISQARMLFSLRRNGTLMGDPRVLVTNVDAAPALTDAFARSLVSAVKACAPFPMDYKLAGAVAGRLLTFRMSFKPNGKAGVEI